MTEYSYGIISLQYLAGQWKTLLVCHQKGHFGFPKGHAQSGELPQRTAVRELKEETGLIVTHFLPFPPIDETYTMSNGIEKKNTYFLAEVRGDIVIDPSEIKEARWVTFQEAEEIATFQEAKASAREASALTTQWRSSGQC